MLKAPVAGQVKTRLAAEIGDAAALRAYRRLVEHLGAGLPPEWPVEVHFSPAEAEADMRHWLGGRALYVPQSPGDLGERLIAAASGAFHRGAAAVFLIGGDCPGLDEATLRTAAAGLAGRDAVLGPAVDGGYYLLGIKAVERTLFEGVSWSTATVADETRARMRRLDWTWMELAEQEDVDDVAAWDRAQRKHPSLGAKRSATG